MPARRIGTVVFDLGGVLIDWNPRHLYRRLFDGDEARMERFLAEVCTQDWNAMQDAGRSWSEAVESLARVHPEHRELIEAYDARWEEMLGGSIAANVAIVEELRRRGVRLFVLSNWSLEKFPIARARYPFLELFDGIVISGEIRACKPDVAAFRALLDRFELDPATTAFVDDSEPNVRAAAALGMIAILAEDPRSLRERLASLELLEPSP